MQTNLKHKYVWFEFPNLLNQFEESSWKSRKEACVASLSMVIGCFCVSCNMPSHHFLQNYQSTQLALRMDRTVHGQVDGSLDPVLVHEPVLSAIW